MAKDKKAKTQPKVEQKKPQKFKVKSWYANRYQFVVVQRNGRYGPDRRSGGRPVRLPGVGWAGAVAADLYRLDAVGADSQLRQYTYPAGSGVLYAVHRDWSGQEIGKRRQPRT